MGIFRAIIPSLSVINKGCGTILLVTILTLCGRMPNVIEAIIINRKNNN